jgi:hypothetical protein
VPENLELPPKRQQPPSREILVEGVPHLSHRTQPPRSSRNRLSVSSVGRQVGTLGVAGYRSAIERLRTLIRAAGKRCYVMSMGRVAPAKLANFPEVDVFVLVACAQTALVRPWCALGFGGNNQR